MNKIIMSKKAQELIDLVEENKLMMKELELLCKAAQLEIKEKVLKGELDAYIKESLK